jgi:phage baseplate assembly protein W
VTAYRDAGSVSTPTAREAADSRLGKGPRFPIRPTDGRLDWLAGEDLVRQSIETILGTEPGERVMQPAFGCGLSRYLMAPNTANTRAAIQQDVTSALGRWEPRIRVLEVTVTPGEEETLLWIDVAYVRLPDLRPDNLVYPFYLA